MLECWRKGYISGIIDAEGSFSVSLKRQSDLKCKIRVQPVFSITQENKDALTIIKEYFKCGRITRKPGQPHLYLYIIDSINELYNCFIAKINSLNIVVRREQLRIFKEIVIELAESLYDRADCCKIRELVNKAYKLSRINSKLKRRFAIHEIIKLIPCNEAEEPPGER